MEKKIEDGWVPINSRRPSEEGYYKVKYSNGEEDEKWYRIRQSKNIEGFLTLEDITHWQPIP